MSERTKWWSDARFGMFIHWGVHSLLKRGMCVLDWERMPNSEYKKLADQFSPDELDTDEWVASAKEAGMKYIYLVTKHLDGFCLWDTETTDFNSVKTAAKRDIVAEYVESCRKADIKVGLYFAPHDLQVQHLWSQSPETSPAGWDEFDEYILAQVGELTTNYGKIDVLWYDGVPVSVDGKPWGNSKLYFNPRQLHPDIIINDRVHSHGHLGDFRCNEDSISGSEMPWESCYTIPDVAWGYNPGDPNIKSTMELIRLMVKCVASGGNFTLNVSPMANGKITPPHADRLKEIGKWMSKSGESIYGAGEAPFYVYTPGHVTARGNMFYVHVLYWPGTEITLAGFKNRIADVRMLATGETVRFDQQGDRLFLKDLPEESPEPADTVFALELEGTPETEAEEWWMIDRWWMRQ